MLLLNCYYTRIAIILKGLNYFKININQIGFSENNKVGKVIVSRGTGWWADGQTRSVPTATNNKLNF